MSEKSSFKDKLPMIGEKITAYAENGVKVTGFFIKFDDQKGGVVQNGIFTVIGCAFWEPVTRG